MSVKIARVTQMQNVSTLLQVMNAPAIAGTKAMETNAQVKDLEEWRKKAR